MFGMRVPAHPEAVVEWRCEELIAAGYPVEEALALAERKDVDLHVAVDLLKHGCDLHVALKILL